MKNLFTIFFALIVSGIAFGQSPDKMSYQAVVRDFDQFLLQDVTVGVQMSVMQGSANGTVVYQETHSTSTNANGLLTLEIGMGTAGTGVFADIDWAKGPYFVECGIDITGGTDYLLKSTSELMSVPYAKHATTATKLTGAKTFKVGDKHLGGMVFYVDETGQHGLVVGLTDADKFTGTVPYELTPQWDGTKWHYLGSGEMNTMRIIALNGYGDYSADVATRFLSIEAGASNNGPGSWYLPCRNELELVYANLVDKKLMTWSTDAFYWTASEWSWAESYKMDSSTGVVQKIGKDQKGHVRAIRKF